MNADKFVKLMRTIISEEVRRVVREELRLSLTEQRYSEPKESSYTPGAIKSKYQNIFEDEFETPNTFVKKPSGPISKNKSVNSLLEETAEQMRTDPASRAFFEGL